MPLSFVDFLFELIFRVRELAERPKFDIFKEALFFVNCKFGAESHSN